jgi:hypothetical protein
MQCFRDFKYTIYRTVISDICVKEWLANMDKINDIRIGRRIKISKNHPVLIGTFYRPPGSLNYTFDLIEHSIDLAVDTGINTIVVLGDFNKTQNIKFLKFYI